MTDNFREQLADIRSACAAYKSALQSYSELSPSIAQTSETYVRAVAAVEAAEARVLAMADRVAAAPVRTLEHVVLRAEALRAFFPGGFDDFLEFKGSHPGERLLTSLYASILDAGQALEAKVA